MNDQASLAARILALGEDCREMTSQLDGLARLAEVDGEQLSARVAQAIRRAAALRSEAGQVLGDRGPWRTAQSPDQLVSLVAEAERRREAENQREAWAARLAKLAEELATYTFDHPSPPLRTAGQEIVRRAIEQCHALSDDEGAMAALREPFLTQSPQVAAWQQLSLDARQQLVAEWPSNASALADLVLSADSLKRTAPIGTAEPVADDSSFADERKPESAGPPASRPAPQSPAPQGPAPQGPAPPPPDRPVIEPGAANAVAASAGESEKSAPDGAAADSGGEAPEDGAEFRTRTEGAVRPQDVAIDIEIVPSSEATTIAAPVQEPRSDRPANGDATPADTVAPPQRAVRPQSEEDDPSALPHPDAPPHPEACAPETDADQSSRKGPVREWGIRRNAVSAKRFAADPAQIAAINEAAWTAIGTDRCGIAYHLLEVAGRTYRDADLLPSSLAAAAALAPAVDGNSSALIDRLQREFADLQRRLHEEKGKEDIWGRRTLSLAVSLQPTLLAPTTEAAAVLQSVPAPSEELPKFSAVCAAIRSYGEHRIVADATLLAGVCDQAEWRKRLGETTKALEDWLRAERFSKVIYAATTNVWQRWLDDSGPVGSVAVRIIDGRADARAAAEQFLDEWSHAKHIDRECKRTDKELRSGGSRRRPIEARATDALRNKVRDFKDQLRSWISLLDARPNAVETFKAEKVQQCRDQVMRAMADALAEVEHLANDRSQPIHMVMACRTAFRQLQSVRNLFDASPAPIGKRRTVAELLNAQLTYIPEIQWDPHAQAAVQLDRSALPYLRGAAVSPRSFEAAFEGQTREQNHAASAILLRFAHSSGLDADRIDRLTRQRAEALSKDRLQLAQLAEETADRITQAVCFDFVNETDRAAFVSVVEDVRVIHHLAENLRPLFTSLRRIAEELDRLKEARLAEVRSKLDSMRLPPERAGDRTIIETTLAKGDFSTADEYIELAKQGQPLEAVDTASTSPFDDYFPSMVNRFEQHTKASPSERIRDWVRALKEGRPFGPGLLADASPEERDDAAQLLEDWRFLQKQDLNFERRHKHLTSYLESVGLDAVSLSEFQQDGATWDVAVECTPIENPRTCSIPQFGSLAGGRYSILGISRRSNDDDIERVVGHVLNRQGGQRPLIVLYFGRLTESRRRRLMESSWGRRSFLVVDEILTVFLATQFSGRLGTLFRCTLPFTTAQPYTTTASHVPIEMFFGRQGEYKTIASREGSNLVYGGRQLGKSALLREVERREHDPARGSIVRWVDLKNRGIGIDRPAEELWSVVAEVLHHEGVLERPMSNPDSIRQKVVNWLQADPARRILLLLDEADAYLEQDSLPKARHSFPVLSGLKGLMDDTNRSFKVVFAGLHNVQRAARDPNTPVAHLGTPVNIGPLLDDGQWRQAQALVERPLQDLGFRFADPGLSLRILSHSNFYPSLIQIFCKHLVQSLHDVDRTPVDFRTCPPYCITGQDIDRVYQSAELQKEIRDRFEWTLKLDQRYRLIAMLIALRAIDSRDAGEPAEGVEVRSIREEALDLWGQGFEQDSSFEQFRIVLDEMVGLGVLRRDADGTYALRSANVLNLLGSRSRIEEVLIDVAESPPPAVYEAAAFRRTLCDGFWVRSPLTAAQEGTLLDRANGVTLLVGCRLAGLDDSLPAIRKVAEGDVRVELCPAVHRLDDFSRWLSSIDQGRSEELTLAVVDTQMPWNAPWVRHALDLMRRKRTARKRFLRVIFVADPIRFWNCGISGHDVGELEVVALRPWSTNFIERWLDDNDLNRDADSAKRVLDAVSGWGRLIQDLGDRCRDGRHLWQEKLEQLRREWPTQAEYRDVAQLPATAESILRRWMQFGGEPLDAPTLQELAPDKDVGRFLAWADQVSYIRAHEGDLWEADPALLQSLRAGEPL